MLGAIAGDIIGSVYESAPIKTKHFPLFNRGCRFTDDSVLTLAIAKACLDGSGYLGPVREFGQRYPDAGYGGTFGEWLFTRTPAPYNSWGNGSAMRVSPIGFAFDTVEDVMTQAAKSAAITHNHPEGIRGAQATALAVFLARTTSDKALIKDAIETRLGYDLSRRLDEIRPTYRFDISCQGTVPEAITAFLESDSFEDAVRNAISLGGDSDTLACITGGIAEAYYGDVPEQIARRVRTYLTADLRDVLDAFRSRFLPGADDPRTGI